MSTIQAILFDKDGTLFDFRKTWASWTARLLEDIGGARAPALAEALRFDLENTTFHPDSPVIAGTLQIWVELMLPHLPERERPELMADLSRRASQATQVPAAPLGPLLSRLRDRGLPLGVATNDAEGPATNHLRTAGIDHLFDFIAGYDTGHGAKPAPGMLLAFAEAVDIPPRNIAMVGDSTHDMEAAKAAGMTRVAVLTGYATAQDLAPHADVVLPTIADLAGWLPAHGETDGAYVANSPDP